MSKFLLALSLLLLLLQLPHGRAAKCLKSIPSVKQTQTGFGHPPKFTVTITNSCPMCPVIEVHVKCGDFPQSLVSPMVFRVVRFDDCVANAGLPLAPLQSVSFNYTHQRFNMAPKSWSYQCE
ncbi:uncharacterized protein At1g05835-like [Asparagus officinalis]|uniref:uncharacterized protein At1g05835-like n=1 Tax=Asparagus officinalis TaxID=4686 RepID=UPI00098E7F7F|nr:uncharacterized protein At1g05835-like [Asparagus officinalis]